MSNIFTDSNFETEVLKSDAPVLVDFWAPWCGPCRTMGPIVDEIGEETQDKLRVGKLNVDENPMAAQKYGVMSIPTFILFKTGQEIDRVTGSMDKEALKDRVLKNV